MCIVFRTLNLHSQLFPTPQSLSANTLQLSYLHNIISLRILITQMCNFAFRPIYIE